MIPKYRFDEVRRREQELQDQLIALKEQLATLQAQGVTSGAASAGASAAMDAAAESDSTKLQEQVAELAKEHAQALIDGDTDRAAELQAKMLTMTSTQVNQQPALDEAAVMNRVAQRLEVKAVATQAEQMYPQLDRTSDQFDQEIFDEVVDMYNALSATKPLPEAMEAAITAVTAIHGLKPVAAAAAPTRGADAKAAAAAMPPSPAAGGTGDPNSGSELSPESLRTMSVDDWAALPASVRQKYLK